MVALEAPVKLAYDVRNRRTGTAVSDLNPSALSRGSLFHGRYEVVRCMKTGGMGAIYEVIHLETKRRRALKVMLPGIISDPDLRARFKLEATVTANIESEHIVETFDAGVDEATGSPFLVMELLRGEDLDTMLQRRVRLPADETVTLLFQAALALDKTHAAGIVHRDLKPENLFITRRDDGSPRLKLLDFGIAKVVEQGTRKHTHQIGTPLYMSPEQVIGDGTLGPASDLHALAHLAYTLLVGESYWDDEATESAYALFWKITRGLSEPPTRRALRRRGVALPPAFDAWLAKAAAVAPTERFTSGIGMIRALADVFSVRPPQLSTPVPPSSDVGNVTRVSPSDPRAVAARAAAATLIESSPSPSVSTPAALVSDRVSAAPRSKVVFVMAAAGMMLAVGLSVLVLKSAVKHRRAPIAQASAPMAAPVSSIAPPIASASEAAMPAATGSTVQVVPMVAEVSSSAAVQAPPPPVKPLPSARPFAKPKPKPAYDPSKEM